MIKKMNLVFENLDDFKNIVFNYLKPYKNANITYFKQNPANANIIKENKHHINAFKHEYNVINNSLVYNLVNKQKQANNGVISHYEYLKIYKMIFKRIFYSTPYLHVYLTDQTPQKNKDLQKFIEYYKHFNINYIIIDITKQENKDKLQNIIDEFYNWK